MEGIIEISKSLFAEACEKTNQIFSPTPPGTCSWRR